MTPKYKFTKEAIDVQGRTLHRIRALRIGPWGPAGTLGGFIESEANLSHQGRAWVGREALVSEDATISEDALVTGNAEISGAAQVSGEARVLDHARVTDRTRVFGQSVVRGEAHIVEQARVFEQAVVTDTVDVRGDAWVRGCTRLAGRVNIGQEADICGTAVLDTARPRAPTNHCSQHRKRAVTPVQFWAMLAGIGRWVSRPTLGRSTLGQ